MKVIAIILLAVGLLMSLWGIWLRRQARGPILVGDVTPAVRALYGVTEAPRWPIAVGMIVAAVGLLLLLA